jgi:hypothetical protein
MNQDQIKTIKEPIPLQVFGTIKNIFKKTNFEFMDLDILPNSLRAVLRDILEVGNSAPFRNYYQWTSSAIYEYAQKNKITEIVELGAGCAPLSRHLVKNYPQWNATFKITDLNPDVTTFKDLEKSDKRISAVYEPLDFTKRIHSYENSLLVLSATFHHVDEKQKKNILTSLKAISPHVMIFEPLRPNLFSLLFVVGALVSGFLTPIFKFNSKNFFRCLWWCWLLPIAPFLFLWDGWVSSIRCWSKEKWSLQEPKSQIEESLFCTKVILNK